MAATDSLLKTSLCNWHVENGGRMVDFAGWSMPVQYGSIIDEHNATRNAFTLFDVSHMGRFQFMGPDAESFLESLTTRRVAGMGIGKIRYSLMTNEAGGILDDVLVYRLGDEQASHFAMVVNASNRTKIADWIKKHQGDSDIGFQDRTEETAMIAVQGPQALAAAAQICALDPNTLSYYTGALTEIDGSQGMVSRTGYTGEDGCELVVDAPQAPTVWSKLLQLGESCGAMAAGLGARDTLRLEAAMPLYGHELSETINPVQAGLGFAINLKDRQFCGRDAIAAFKKDKSLPCRIGLELDGRRAAREHSVISVGGLTIGEVTSGTFSPTLQKPIAMGYVPREHSELGMELQVEIRGTQHAAKVVELPFYRR